MSEETSPTPTDTTPERKTPGLFRNYVSLFGAAIVAASLASIVLLFLIELSVGTENPYLGIFTYVILPGFLIFGIVTILAGMYFERRSEEHTSELQSHVNLVCRLLLEKKNSSNHITKKDLHLLSMI